jgi:Rad3-related DNA helicase
MKNIYLHERLSEKDEKEVFKAFEQAVDFEQIEIENSRFTVFEDTAYLKFYVDLEDEKDVCFYAHIFTFCQNWKDDQIESLNENSEEKTDLESEEESGRLKQTLQDWALEMFYLNLTEGEINLYK